MANRRILVFDKDSAFLELLRSSLDVYGFDIRPLEPGPDNIQALKVHPPEIIFISADLPDNAGYSLCSTIRKTIGNSICLVVTTAVLSPHDLSLHGKQRLHADLYLDKRVLSDEILIRKLGEMIKLGPRIKPLPSDTEADLEQGMDSDTDGLSEAYSSETYQTQAPSDPDTAFEHGAISGPTEQDITEEGNSVDPQESSGAEDPWDGKDADPDNDVDRIMTEQRAEIYHLRRQLEVALRDARSSPFSTDFHKLREVITQKDWEITRLTEQLNSRSREILSHKNKIKELEKERLNQKTELGRILKHEEELSRLVQDQHREIGSLQEFQKTIEEKRSYEANRATELLNMEQQAHNKTREDFEALIARLQEQHVQTMKLAEQEKQIELASARQMAAEEQRQAFQKTLQDLDDRIVRYQDQYTAAMKQAEQEKKAALEEAHQNSEQNLAAAVNSREESLVALKREYSAILSGKEAEIEALKQLTGEEQEAREKTRRDFESEITRLKDFYDAAMKQAKQERQAELATINRQAGGKLAEVEQKHRQELAALKFEHNSIVSEKEAEIQELQQRTAEEQQQALQKSSEEFKARILRLQEQHAATLKKAEKDKQDELAAAYQEAGARLADAEQKRQQAIDALKLEHDAILSGKEAEMASLRQRLQEEQSERENGQEVEAWIARLQEQHAQAMKQAEVEKQADIAAARQHSEKKITETHRVHQNAIDALKSQYEAVVYEKEAEITALKDTTQNKQHEAHRKVVRDFEERIARLTYEHAQAMKQAQEERTKALETFQIQNEERLANAENEKQLLLETLKKEFDEQIDQLMVEKETEAENSRRKAIAEKEAEFESLIKKIMTEREAETADLSQRVIAEKEAEFESLIKKVMAEKEAEIADLSQRVMAEKEAAIADLSRKAAADFETQIAMLKEKHDQAMKQAEKEKNMALQSTHKQVEEMLVESEKDHHHVLNALKTRYSEQVAQLQSEKTKEVEAIKQKAKERLIRAEKEHKEALQALQNKLAKQNEQQPPPANKAEEAPRPKNARPEQVKPKFTRVQYQPIDSSND